MSDARPGPSRLEARAVTLQRLRERIAEAVKSYMAHYEELIERLQR